MEARGVLARGARHPGELTTSVARTLGTARKRAAHDRTMSGLADRRMVYLRIGRYHGLYGQTAVIPRGRRRFRTPGGPEEWGKPMPLLHDSIAKIPEKELVARVLNDVHYRDTLPITFGA